MTPAFPASIFSAHGGDEADVLRNFHLCTACRQPVDRRDLRATFHHAQALHDPMLPQEAVRLLSQEDRLRLLALVEGR